MGLFVVDVESDGPIPYDYSMVCFGVVYIDDEEKLNKTFYAKTAPLENALYNPEALAISGFTREEHLKFPCPKTAMTNFNDWIKKVNIKGRPIAMSDNIAYDWQWINWYFHHFLGTNPFGYSGRRISDLYCGLVKDMRAPWKHLRKTVHDHNPVNDAKGNAEAFLHLKNKLGLKLHD